MNVSNTIISDFDTVRCELLLSFLSLKSISGHYHSKEKGYKLHPSSATNQSCPLCHKIKHLSLCYWPWAAHNTIICLINYKQPLFTSFSGNSPSCAGTLTPFAVYCSGIHSVITLPENLKFFHVLKLSKFQVHMLEASLQPHLTIVPKSPLARPVLRAYCPGPRVRSSLLPALALGLPVSVFPFLFLHSF